MNLVTKNAWNQGLLSSIMQLKSLLEQQKTQDPFMAMLTRRMGIKEPYNLTADLFVSLAGFESWLAEKNDKTEWEIDESGETVFFIPPITYYYFEPGLLARWGLVDSGQVYIGESNGDDDVSFDDNKLTPENRARVLSSHAEVCRFLSKVSQSELSHATPTTIIATDVVKQCMQHEFAEKTIQNWMSDPTFPAPIKTGRNRVFLQREVASWLKTKRGIEL